jgi:hypothetical protein
MMERALLMSPRVRTLMMNSPRRTRATGTSTSVVPVYLYAAMAPPPHNATPIAQVMIFTLRGFDLPNRWLGL